MKLINSFAGICVEGLKTTKKTLSQPHYPLYDSLICEITRFLWDNLLIREAGQNLCLSYQSVCGTRISVLGVGNRMIWIFFGSFTTSYYIIDVNPHKFQCSASYWICAIDSMVYIWHLAHIYRALPWHILWRNLVRRVDVGFDLGGNNFQLPQALSCWISCAPPMLLGPSKNPGCSIRLWPSWSLSV
jgi:hypothetical protein